MKRKVLVCGQRSFVASGVTDLLTERGIEYDCFSRGEEARRGSVVSGDVMRMSDNPCLGDDYSTVVNFIIIKDRSVEENIEYAKSLLDFCESRRVKHLIQISSISAYPNGAKYVNETSGIESDWHNKGGYAAIKVAVDHYLMDNKPESLFISFVRPGFIYTKNHEINKTGILISKFGINILLGDKKTSLPLICRETLHDALIKIIEQESPLPVYLLLNKDKEEGTKYNFVRKQWNVRPLCLPYTPIMLAAKVMKSIGVFKERHYLMFEGLFKRTWFDSSVTEETLDVNLGPRRIAILGAGTYGIYVSNILSLVYPHERLDLYDVGDENVKDEEGIGFLSHITNAPYKGLQNARFFGYGGASVKWGGQLLVFTQNDFSSPTQYMKDIVSINEKHKDTVLARFNLENKIPEIRLEGTLFTKTGIWLSYFHRNLFKHFKIGQNKKINIIPGCRVTRILHEGNNVTGFEYLNNGNVLIGKYDQYFLTSGAFESARILVHSGLSKQEGLMPFSDHLSQKAFKIKSGIVMGGIDFRFLVRGASLITKRFVGEVDGHSFYSQPLCNEDFSFFNDLKRLLFGHEFSLNLILDIVKNIPQCFAFAWYILVLKKMYIYKNEFNLQIDIEAPRDSGKMTLNEEKDKYGEKSIDVDFTIMPKTGELFTKARAMLKAYLDKNGVEYEELPFSTSAEKYEDVYHPFGMFCDFSSADDYFYHFPNMLVVNTGVLPRAGGINSTCAVFPLVEEYIDRMR